MSTRNRRSDGRGATASISRGPPSSPTDGKNHLHLNVKVSSNKLRQATSGRSSVNSDRDPGGEIIPGKRNRGGKKNYVVDSDSDEEEVVEEEDEDAEGEDDDEDMDDLGDEDADGEADEEMMDIDAEGEEEELGDEDADGEEDTEMLPMPPTITVSKPAPAKSSSRAMVAHLKSSDDELSELDSDEEIEEMDETVQVDAEGEEGDAEGEEDAEGEDDDDIQVPVAPALGADEDDDLDSDDDEDMSRAETPDFSKMTKRQRARFEDEPQQYMKLSDEVQVKKHLTAEEQSMRRAEMARRRRNLSEKRNEEVKMETINKLLKKQAPKTNRKTAAGGDEGSPEDGVARANAMFVRWVSTKNGNRVGVPDEMLAGPIGRVFVSSVAPAKRRLIEEVS